MIFSRIKNSVSEALMLSSYSRTAMELMMFSDKQLADIGISRSLLKLGPSAYPWRADVDTKEIPDNVTNLDSLKVQFVEMDTPKTPKAA